MGFFTGIQLYGKAFGILFSRKFWWFLLFPVIILLLLFIGGNILISLAGDSLYGLIEAKPVSYTHLDVYKRQTYMLDKTTGYIKLSRFAATTIDEFEEAVKKLQAQGMNCLLYHSRWV